jgi:TusA-related sulfurtransferase
VPEAPPRAVAVVDARGLECPLPVFHARDAMFDLKPGEVLEVLADDPQAPSDLETWARRDGHLLVSITTQARGFRVLVRHGADHD